MPDASRSPSAALARLRDPAPLIAVEMRPPQVGLSAAQSMNTWIDMYHAVGRLAKRDTIVFITDNAVGQAEEENLGHLAANLAGDVSPAKLVPFLTAKHSLDYCLKYAARAVSLGFDTLTILGGDKSVGPPRCVEYAWQLRRIIREKVPGATLGGWANPLHGHSAQVDYLLQSEFTAEFYLTQIVSHYSVRPVEAFLAEASRRGVSMPGMFGVFYYRSAKPATLETLSQFLPVPVGELQAEFAGGGTPESVCARSIRELTAAGVRHFYVSNLPIGRAAATLQRILSLV